MPAPPGVKTETLAFGGSLAKLSLPLFHSSIRCAVSACPADLTGRSANTMAFYATPLSVSFPSTRLAPRAFMTISDGTMAGLAWPIVFCSGTCGRASLVPWPSAHPDAPNNPVTATTVQMIRFASIERAPPDGASGPRLLVKREDPLPVTLHGDHRPPVLLGLVVERGGERADLGGGQAQGRAIGILALLVVVQHQHHQPLAAAGTGIFQHLAVAVRVAECRIGPAADHQV